MYVRFEQNIQDWYNTSSLADLHWLNLESSLPTAKEYHRTINNNLSVVFGRLSLFAKVSLKFFHQIEERDEVLQNRLISLEEINRRLLKRVEFLEKSTLHIQGSVEELVKNYSLFTSGLSGSEKPVTKTEVQDLLATISEKPKEIEEKTIRITQNLEVKLTRVETLLQQIGKVL